MSKLEKIGAILALIVLIIIGLISCNSPKEQRSEPLDELEVNLNPTLVVVHFNDATTLVKVINNPEINFSYQLSTYVLYINRKIYFKVKYYETYHEFNSNNIKEGLFTTDYYVTSIEPYIKARDSL